MAKKTTRKRKTTRRNSRKKQQRFNNALAVISLMVISILILVLVYFQSGYIGKTLSPLLGGVMGVIKYIFPIGLFWIAICMMYNDRNYLTDKLRDYGIFILCATAILSIHQINIGHMGINDAFENIIKSAYDLGTMNIGGGFIGIIIAEPLVKMLGIIGANILIYGASFIWLITILGMNPLEFFMDNYNNKKQVTNSNIEEPRGLGKVFNRQKYQPEPIDAKNININIPEANEEEHHVKYNHAADDIVPLELEKKRKKVKNMTNYDNAELSNERLEGEQENLFVTEDEKKEKKTRERLNIKHTQTVEDVDYDFPNIELLGVINNKSYKGTKRTITENAAKLQRTLNSFGVSAKVENVSVGPAITRYELKPAEGVRVSKIANLADDIALSLAAESIRIEAPIPGKQAVGIEVPNREKEIVHLREIIDTQAFKTHKSKLAVALGKDVAGTEVVTDIAKMPHVLIAGSTGSGKSVCINTIIVSILYKAKPSEVKLVMIDPKVVELSVYNGIPHLLIPVVTNPKKAAGALAWAVQEMENRYSMFAQKGARDIKSYNAILDKEGNEEKLPQIVIIIDELADLMMVAPNDVEDAICRLAQKARASGMYLVIATQRPSVDVITGIIKANIPSRIAFAVSSQVDSRTILDMAGAEKLLGKGDMLFYPTGVSKPTRIQGAFVSDQEVEDIVASIKTTTGECTYNDDVLQKIEKANSSDKDSNSKDNEDDVDPFLFDAIDTVIETRTASTSFIQRRFKVGYARAGRIIDQMEERGVISGYEGSKPRQVLMTKEQWEELKMAENNESHDKED